MPVSTFRPKAVPKLELVEEGREEEEAQPDPTTDEESDEMMAGDAPPSVADDSHPVAVTPKVTPKGTPANSDSEGEVVFNTTPMTRSQSRKRGGMS